MLGPSPIIVLRPGILNRKLWGGGHPAGWQSIRRQVLTRDDYTCLGCGHRALKGMTIDHLAGHANNELGQLATLCIACHAIRHLGRNMSGDLKVLEVYESDISQVEIVRRTRAGVKAGLSLEDINAQLPIRPGPKSPDDIAYANQLGWRMGDAIRAELPEPLCVVFVRFQSWQLD